MVLLVLLFCKFFEVFNRNTLLKNFLGPDFRHSNSRIFYSRDLGIGFIDIKSISTRDLKVNIADKNNRQEACFGLNINGFFDYFGLTI